MTRSDITTRNTGKFEANESFAKKMDSEDKLASFRSNFLFPKDKRNRDVLYFAGNSLGLQPAKARTYIEEELDDWAKHGVEGHFDARHPWLPYHENLTDMTARLVGALPSEVVVMNTLTVNLHLMMATFYRPTPSRYKIVIEHGAFPSDKYAVDSQARHHGFDPAEAVVELKPRSGEHTLRTDDIINALDKHGGSVAVVMLGQVNYLTGQAFDVPKICKAAHSNGADFGLNLAHGAGNLLLQLHDWDVDFAMWCGYKYLNAGPGALAGCFIHERHATDTSLPRLAGWWGHDKQSRFQMGPDFHPIPTAEGWQLSNPPIFQLAALRASLELFDQATMPALRRKSERLTAYLEYLLSSIPNKFIELITPEEPQSRGCQLSFRVKGQPRELLAFLKSEGAICDYREPNILRAAPAPLYTSFLDVYRFVNLIAEHERSGAHK